MKDIIDKIEEKYSTEDGEDWVIEKGKVREVKMIKECYTEILKQRKRIRELNNWHSSEFSDRLKAERAVTVLEDKIEKLEESLANAKEKVITSVTNSLEWL